MADSLETLHRKIDDLTDPDGEYAVVCSLSGKHPVPVRGMSFPTPEVAEEAVDLVVKYRTLLRDVDPHLENVPIVVCEQTADPLSLDASEAWAARERMSRGRGRDASESDESASSERPANGRGRPWSQGDSPENVHESTATVTLSGDGDEEWLRLTGAPVVRVREDGEPVDDAVVGLELNAKL